MMTYFLTQYDEVSLRLRYLIRSVTTLLVSRLNFVPRYYRLNSLIWEDGMLIDFLQKKVTDKWIRRFLIYSSYLVSERIIFTFVARFYMDFIIFPLNTYVPFDFSSVSSLLTGTLAALIFIVLVFNLNYLYWTFITF